MGIKYTDILIKNHDHAHFMEYMRTFQFEKFLTDKLAHNYKTEAKTFPMHKILEIDSHKIYSWERDVGEGKKFKDWITVETNASVPWARIAVREANIYSEEDWAEMLSLIYPKADVSVLSYHSVSDYSFVESYRNGKCVRSVSFDFESKPIIQWMECEDLTVKEPWETWIKEISKHISADDAKCDYCPTNFTYYYWTHLFPEIPVRYSLTEYAWESHEKTLEHLQNVIEAEPECYEFLFEKGYILNEIGKYKEAIEVFLRLLELKPDYDVQWNIGFAYIGLKDYDKAIEYYDKSIKSGYDRSLTGKSYALIRKGKYDEAIQCCDELTEKKLKISDAYVYTISYSNAVYNKACAYALKGDRELALKFLKEEVDRYPERKQEAQDDNDFESLWNDADFKEIVKNEKS